MRPNVRIQHYPHTSVYHKAVKQSSHIGGPRYTAALCSSRKAAAFRDRRYPRYRNMSVLAPSLAKKKGRYCRYSEASLYRQHSRRFHPTTDSLDCIHGRSDQTAQCGLHVTRAHHSHNLRCPPFRPLLCCAVAITIVPGMQVPADCRLIGCTDMTVDNSQLTGENEPQKRRVTADSMAVCEF
jgi:E1-E2 ATPase